MNSVLFATATTGTSCGAVNAMHDSFMPLAGLIPLRVSHCGQRVGRTGGPRQFGPAWSE